MKKAPAVLCALLAFASLLPAQPPPGPLRPPLRPGTVRPQQVKRPDAASRAGLMAKLGGMIDAPESGPAVLFLNAQKRIPAETARGVSALVRRNLRLPAVAADAAPAEPVAAAVRALADTNTAAVVVLADAPGYPALLLAPESRWALVNVDALAEGGAPDALIEERAAKELWRAFGYLMGAANSNFAQCLLKPVSSPADLDALTAKTLSPEPYGKIIAHAQRLGIRPARRTTYRKAVEEGWAPAPTNDLQRAVWEAVKGKAK